MGHDDYLGIGINTILIGLLKIPAIIEFCIFIFRKGRNGILANYMGNRRSNFQAAMRSANNACSDILEEDSSNISTNQVRLKRFPVQVK